MEGVVSAWRDKQRQGCKCDVREREQEGAGREGRSVL
jgi:hypothetical protein